MSRDRPFTPLKRNQLNRPKKGQKSRLQLNELTNLMHFFWWTDGRAYMPPWGRSVAHDVCVNARLYARKVVGWRRSRQTGSQELPAPSCAGRAFHNILHCMAYKKVTRPPKTRSESETLQGSRERLRTQMFKGVAELALLSVVQQSAEYGLRILELLRDEAGLEIAEGTLYPLLYRLEKRGSIQSEWRVLDEASHPRKYYAITSQGKAELKAHLDDWRAMTVAFNRFLNRGKK